MLLRPISLVVIALVLSAATALPGSPPDQELGNFIDRSLFASRTLVLDVEVNRNLATMSDRLGRVAGFDKGKIKVRIVNESQLRAYATTGGFAYVSTGLLDVLEGPDELAAVIAHAMDHLVQDDLSRRFRSKKRRRGWARAGAYASIAALGALDAYSGNPFAGYNTASNTFWETVGLVQGLGTELSEVYLQAIIVGYDEKRELQADLNAVRYLQAAGYDPSALERVLRRLDRLRREHAVAPSQMSSAVINAVPGLEKRIERLTALRSASSPAVSP